MSHTTLGSPIIVKANAGTSLPHSMKKSSTLSAPTEPTWKEGSTRGKGREDSLPIPAFSPSNSFASSSSSISPSLTTTTDTSVASETDNDVLAYDTNTREKHKAEEQATELNDDKTMMAMDPNADTDSKPTDTTAMTIASLPASAPPTPASSSSTSIPLPTPFNSSTPTSTSPSTTNVNDLGVDANGLTSLLRPRPQINQNMNVKFAPLPELAPRKRKSSTPLGMAARSQLARRRRMMYRDSYDDDEMYEESYRPRRFNPPEISEKEEIEAADGSQESSTKKKKSKKLKEGEMEGKEKKEGEQSEDEDPLAALAKKMGRAGKHLWRKMSIGGKGEKGDVGEDDKKLKVGPVLVPGNAISKPDEEHQGVEQGQGNVWTEEVGEQYNETRETRGNGTAKIEPTLHEASSIPLPPSEPQSPIDVISPSTLRPSSQETSETEVMREEDTNLDDKLNGHPTTPAIIVSVA